MQRDDLTSVVKCAAYGQQSLTEKLGCDSLIADTVGGEFLFVDINIQLLMLSTEGFDIAHSGYGAQPFLEHIHVAVHLTESFVARVQRH